MPLVGRVSLIPRGSMHAEPLRELRGRILEFPAREAGNPDHGSPTGARSGNRHAPWQRFGWPSHPKEPTAPICCGHQNQNAPSRSTATAMAMRPQFVTAGPAGSGPPRPGRPAAGRRQGPTASATTLCDSGTGRAASNGCGAPLVPCNAGCEGCGAIRPGAAIDRATGVGDDLLVRVRICLTMPSTPHPPARSSWPNCGKREAGTEFFSTRTSANQATAVAQPAR